MWDTFKFKEPNKYTLRRGQNLKIPEGRTTRAVNSFDFRAVMAWNQLPADIKAANTKGEFSNLIKSRNVYCECNNCA